ncbi:MAG: large conductance mechanosensitive channel protein MscL [Ornithinimicrobium sp.]
MLNGFKDFLMRGNIVDLAVAVVIGTAFSAVVNTVVSSLIEPILAVFGGAQSDGLTFRLVNSNEATAIDISAIINAFVVFLITAAVVYFVFVVPSNRLAERRARDEEPEPEAVAEDVLVLREIRDLMRERDPQREVGPR